MKHIEGFEGLYSVTRGGEVWSSRRKGGFLATVLGHRGYFQVTLCRDGKKKIKKVHRLVAEAFIENPENKPQVNHIDGNKQNNSVSNLEWATSSENQLHAFANGLNDAKGELNSQSKLTEEQVIEIWYRIPYETQKSLAKEFGVSRMTISDIKLGKTWSHVTSKLP